MRISDRLELDAVRGADRARPAGEVGRGGEAQTRRGERGSLVEVAFSGRAHELASSASRIAQLRASVQDGSFRVDAHAIAARLVPGDDR